MNKATKTIALTGVNLLALSMAKAQAMGPTAVALNHSGNASQIDEASVRAIEASHLAIFAPCKWGHAAFDPVKVDAEAISADVEALHGLVG